MFDHEAPIVSGLGFGDETTAGIKTLVVRTHVSAEKETRIRFTFDGAFYRQNQCYEVSIDGAAEKTESVPCQ